MADFYTGMGDEGNTSIGNRKVRKSDSLISAIGEIDELNSVVGLAAANITDGHVLDILKGIQNELFIVGAELSSSYNGTFSPKRKIGEETIKDMENVIEEYGKKIGKLKSFVLPGGTIGAAYLHNARTVARRAERSLVGAEPESKIDKHLIKYMNRISSLLFVLALYINKSEGYEEINPEY
jgi:cob(I)alamin adenosyltransferase